MRVALVQEHPREVRPLSIQLYVKEITSRLTPEGFEFTELGYDAAGPDPDTDLIWAPAMGVRLVPPVLARIGDVPLVTTLHGVDDWHLSLTQSLGRYGLKSGLGQYRWRARIRAGWAALMEKSPAVITVSTLLQDQVQSALGLGSETITVIYNGVNEMFFAPLPNPAPAREGILHISQASHVKNVPRLLAAYDSVAAQIETPLQLICVGYQHPGPMPKGVTFSDKPIPHGAVAQAMERAQLLAFPSLSEPFGLPVAEAMARGLPVLTSKDTGAAEVAGGAAELVDPWDVEDIARGLQVVTQPARLEEMTQAGLARAQTFTWASSAARHGALFRAVLETGATALPKEPGP